MATQQPSTSATSPPIEESPRKSDLSVTKVSAAALAALTAAVLGSTIGVAGTVIGAAVASVITTVSSALYQRSLERSREGVRLLAARTIPLPRQRSEPDVSQPDVPQPEVPQSPTAALEDVQPLAVPGPTTARPRRTVRWSAMAAGSVAAFALAMMVITGFENTTGQTLSDGNTPTVSQVFGGEKRTPEPAPEVPAPEMPTAPSESPEPTSSPEATSTSGPEELDPSTGTRPTGTRTPTDARPTGTTDTELPGIPLPTR
ncbi:MAG: hypothetical protein M3291_05950 [Actinomycetota bacterium]|nr:hypothetical protein [Actinomycetota bacterium]